MILRQALLVRWQIKYYHKTLSFLICLCLNFFNHNREIIQGTVLSKPFIFVSCHCNIHQLKHTIPKFYIVFSSYSFFQVGFSPSTYPLTFFYMKTFYFPMLQIIEHIVFEDSTEHMILFWATNHNSLIPVVHHLSQCPLRFMCLLHFLLYRELCVKICWI